MRNRRTEVDGATAMRHIVRELHPFDAETITLVRNVDRTPIEPARDMTGGGAAL